MWWSKMAFMVIEVAKRWIKCSNLKKKKEKNKIQ